MPGRSQPLVTEQIYHIFNKSIDKKRIFEEKMVDQIFLDTAKYYRSSESSLRFSVFRKLAVNTKNHIELKIINKLSFRVSVLAYCLMPTHYHFLLRQNLVNGISIFMSQIQNSVTRYYNIKFARAGPIFLQTFKSKLMQSEEQLKHVSRYIHLNPFSNGLVQKIDDLNKYPFSSFSDYLHPFSNSLTEVNYLLSLFDNDTERYKRFVFDNAQHQKMLEYCKYSKRW